jgi:hypothetical protein
MSSVKSLLSARVQHAFGKGGTRAKGSRATSGAETDSDWLRTAVAFTARRM